MLNLRTLKQLKKRNLFAKKEIEFFQYRILLKNNTIQNIKRFIIQTRLVPLARRCSLTRIKNTCLLTNNSRNVFKYTKSARISTKNLIFLKKLNGFRRSKW